jgi:subtilisin family serine protease
MSIRTRLIGTASAALISVAMIVAPTGAFAAPSGHAGSSPDPNGPPGHPGVAAPKDPSAGSAKSPQYKPKASPGFKAYRSTDAPADATDKLGATDTKLLQKAQVDKKKTVTVLMIAREGGTADVVSAVQRAGGTVSSVTPKLGYVRATIPTDSVTDLAGMTIVKAIDLNRTYRVPTPDLGTESPKVKVATSGAGPAAPDASTPVDNPYLPINETGAASFVSSNPAWDGRGTVVGVLDTGIDVDHPALQKTSDGKTKIVDWVTETDPIVDNDATWVRMETPVTGPSFRYGGKSWTAPAGAFRIGWFYESATMGSDFGGDLNSNGSTSDRFGLLYEPTTHKMWVDADNDQDFTDQPGMTAYGVDHQIGHFGVDKPGTAVDESIPFVVQSRDGVDLTPLGGSNVGKTASFVNIGLPSDAHATHVAGIIAGTSMLGGRMHGAAPGAQLVSARACTWGGGCTTAALTEGMIDLVTNHHVDVVNLSVGGLQALNDGSDVIAALYDELIDTYGVQIVVAAGNDGLGTNTVASPAVASRAIAVAASVSSDTWWADYGSKVSTKEGIFGFSSRGPAEDGSLAPQVSAPGAAVSSIPMWLPGQSVPETGYSLPVGYAMENGTSMATPQVAGSAALLLSAAKANAVAVSPAALKTALIGTARHIDGVPTTAQGAGVVDTGAAWKQLAQKVSVNALTVSAPVCSPLAYALATPNTGTGVYNRCLPTAGGQVTGVQKTYKVSVTRTSGTSGSIVHRIGWIGNDGTFSARAALPLQLRKSADVTVTATAETAGVHSAIMTVDDPATPGIDQFVNVTVMATTPIGKPGFAVTTSGTLPRTGTTSVLVPVPAGVEALQLTLTGVKDGSQVRVLPIDPDGVPADGNASNHCYTGYTDPTACDATARAVERPKAGIWEFVIETRRTSDTDANTYSATVALQGMSFSPALTTLDSAVVNTSQDVSTSATNAFAPVTAHVADGAIGTLVDRYATVADGEMTMNQVDVPRQSTRLDMTITARDASSDIDMYLIYADGSLMATSTAIGQGPERIVLDNPRPGTYYVVAAGVTSTSGSTTFDYHEEMYSKGLGSVTPTSTQAHRLASGQSMSADVKVTLATRQLTTQPLAGRVQIANSYGTVIGAADVRISKVTIPQLDVQKWEKPFVGADLNENGEVGGDRQFNSLMTPTVWSAADGFRNLELVGGEQGSVLGLNDSREAAGILYDDAGSIVPAMWAADGTMTAIGMPGWRAYTLGFATGINNAGTVTGFAELRQKEADGLWHQYHEGYTYTRTGGFSKLADLSDNPAQTQPLAINAAGATVGDSLTSEGFSHAVMWNGAGAVNDLGVLPGQATSSAKGINASGEVVGVSGDDAFVWTASGGMKRLPDFGFNASAVKVTDDGWILGTVEIAPDDEVSALWDPQGRLWDVSGMIPSTSGFFLPTYSFGINEKHQLMVYGLGGDSADGSSSTVLLHIPDSLAK